MREREAKIALEGRKLHIGGLTRAISPRVLRDYLDIFGVVEEFKHAPINNLKETSAFVVFA